MLTIPFVNIGKSIPAISFTLGNSQHTYYALLDTGTETTLFDWSIQEKEGVNAERTDSTINFINVSGESPQQEYMPVNVAMQINTSDGPDTLLIGGVMYDLKAISASFGSADVVSLIGSDFFDNVNATIDYDNKVLCIDK